MYVCKVFNNFKCQAYVDFNKICLKFNLRRVFEMTLLIFFFALFSSVFTGSDTSYTLGLLDNLSKPASLGTSWNVFGVPGSNVKTSNPYARMGNISRK